MRWRRGAVLVLTQYTEVYYSHVTVDTQGRCALGPVWGMCLLSKYILSRCCMYVVEKEEGWVCWFGAPFKREKKGKHNLKFTPGFSNRRKMERGEMMRKSNINTTLNLLNRKQLTPILFLLLLLLFSLSLSQWKKSEHGIGISDPQGIVKILDWKYVCPLHFFASHLSEIPPLR
jgi:hypothetical protein